MQRLVSFVEMTTFEQTGKWRPAVQCRFLPFDASVSGSKSLSNTAAMMPRDPMFIMGSWLAEQRGGVIPLRAQRVDHGAPTAAQPRLRGLRAGRCQRPLETQSRGVALRLAFGRPLMRTIGACSIVE